MVPSLLWPIARADPPAAIWAKQQALANFLLTEIAPPCRATTRRSLPILPVCVIHGTSPRASLLVRHARRGILHGRSISAAVGDVPIKNAEYVARRKRNRPAEIVHRVDIGCGGTFCATATGWKLNFCPPTDASTIRPSSPIVKTATPSAYLALAEAPDLSATAEA